MPSGDPFRHAVLGSGVFYRDPRAAMAFLQAAFGFEPSMLVSDADGRLVHAEMRFGDGYIVVDSEWADHVSSPASVGGRNTQSVYVRLQQDLDVHCEKARAAGAVILEEPADHFYGERQYNARDFNGHHWDFTQTIADIEPESWGGVSVAL